MIFQHTYPALKLGKTQTRRVVKYGERARYIETRTSHQGLVLISSKLRRTATAQRILENDPDFKIDPTTIYAIQTGAGRLLQKVDGSYLAQPGRGLPGIERITINALRPERLQDISPDDAMAELGDIRYWVQLFMEQDNVDDFIAYSDQLEEVVEEYPVTIYKWLWMSFNTHKGERWSDNPIVWVKSFDPIGDGEDVYD